ncbi:prostaglandin E synthase 3-like [Dendronephthya gigantea]|uniref:prostaglandin E synthase 3-like n=1 Tax=Dendronephthya gigantea TaxID=151771 RepID=UPI00106DD16A|nr:prostaglandin E synthase 3-like [Dendronephthya gigantea]
MAETRLLHPLVVWAQRKDIVFLTIRLEDTRNQEIQLDEEKMYFRSKGGHDQQLYGFEFKFFGSIIPENSKQHITNRELTFVLKKKDADKPYWPRLLETKDKITYIKTDFDKWKDEDDSDDDENTNDNFEDMMRQMGDIGMGGGGAVADDGNEPDSDDSDDEGMPDLE